MANYLARVAASGTASQPMARPSLIAPPILPGRVPASEPDQAVRSPIRSTLAQPTIPVTVAPGLIDQVASPPARPVAATERAVSAVPDETLLERPVTPKSTSSAPQPARLGPSPAAGPNIVRAPRMRPTAQESEATAPRHFEFRPEPVSIVQLPRAFGHAQSDNGGETAGNASPIAGPAAVSVVARPAQSADPVLPSKAAATARQIERSEQQRGPGTPIERRIISVPQVGMGNTIVEMPPAGTSRREQKITIGQIDVQVINTPPVAPQQPAPSPTTSNVTNVELERVRWRPL